MCHQTHPKISKSTLTNNHDNHLLPHRLVNHDNTYFPKDMLKSIDNVPYLHNLCALIMLLPPVKYNQFAKQYRKPAFLQPLNVIDITIKRHLEGVLLVIGY